MPSITSAADIKVAVTTSFHNSGLSDILLPAIKKDLDLDVHLLVVGTGQALKLGRQGDVDAILVHSKKAEQKFVEEGYAPYRREIMYNDFVLIGPATDPVNIKAAKTAKNALQRIQQKSFEFVSRGDDSGTHRKELALWKNADLDPSEFEASWYKAAGAGMGATLNMASSLNAYVMADRASWLNFKNKRDLKLLFSGDPVLFNQYAFLPVSEKKHPHVKRQLAEKLEGWLTSQKGQQLIADYRLAGEQLFVPNATAVQTGS
ncbi:substrate-binding domain-containing protein [Sneathiella limimaris]|uniref:substrate-binding domain-containing protein n=1 Tax=Sneathiella limimaris TaxID=1964213 RepID=UPI0019D31F18|nr:substrate-binding domain-containing protein [Sneathiella limimaris]